MKTSTVDPATLEDIQLFAKDAPYPSMKAWTGKVEGKPVALGGLARGRDGRWMIFFDITDEARPYKMMIVKTARMIMSEARKMNLKFVYAMPDCNEPLAMKWLGRLGFEPDTRSGIYMRWKNGE